jgi:NitT/TauT family transport system substrate-binding protein
VAWEIAIQKNWFEEAGVDVNFQWYSYGASMDAYASGQVDAVCVTNGDMLVTGATGRPSTAILINDFSNGNDMVVGRPGIDSVEDLKGKKVGVEKGYVCHLLLLKALEAKGISPDSVEIVNVPTNETPQVLKAGAVDAIAAWQPNSGQALKVVDGAKPIFTSADVPGLIYDLLIVARPSLQEDRERWQKVVGVWYRVVDYLMNPSNFDEALRILSARVNVSPAEYEPFFRGTKILTLEQSLNRWEDKEGLKSLYGSTRIVNQFNVANGVYDEPLNVEAYLDPSFVEEYAESVGAME